MKTQKNGRGGARTDSGPRNLQQTALRKGMIVTHYAASGRESRKSEVVSIRRGQSAHFITLADGSWMTIRKPTD